MLPGLTQGRHIFAPLGSSLFETYTFNAYVSAGAAITGFFLNVYNTSGNG